jgi:hypothetical protein
MKSILRANAHGTTLTQCSIEVLAIVVPLLRVNLQFAELLRRVNGGSVRKRDAYKMVQTPNLMSGGSFEMVYWRIYVLKAWSISPLFSLPFIMLILLAFAFLSLHMVLFTNCHISHRMANALVLSSSADITVYYNISIKKHYTGALR